jgi:hypothetical protein
MKNFLFAMALISVANGAFAQTTKTTGATAQKASSTTASSPSSWGIAIGAVVIVGTIVGVTCAAATDNQTSSAH